MSSARMLKLAGLPSAQGLADLANRQRAIADAAAVTEIESNAALVQLGEQRWYDIRPMLDPKQHPAEFLDVHVDHIAYAIQRGLVTRSATAPHLVRMAR